MTHFQAFVFGCLQGLTEFLPVSSSAHLFLAPWFFKWPDPGLAFDVFLHGGTLLALLIYFAKDWWQLTKAGMLSVIERKIGFHRERKLAWLIIVATIPAGLAGLLLEKHIESAFRAPLLVAASLAMMGFFLYWIDGKYPSVRHLEEMTFKDALWIGFAQCLALFPGVSRSGATITMGRLQGFHRPAAARFAFLMAMPITMGAFLHKLPEVRHLAQQGALPWPILINGFLTSFLTGLFAIHALLTYVRSADFRIFAWYRVLLAGAILAWSLMCGC